MKHLAALLSWLQSFPQLQDGVEGGEDAVRKAFAEVISEIYGETIDSSNTDWKEFLSEKYPDVAARFSSNDPTTTTTTDANANDHDQMQSELTANLLSNVLRYAVSEECARRTEYIKYITQLPTNIKRSLKRIIEHRVLSNDTSTTTTDCCGASQVSMKSSNLDIPNLSPVRMRGESGAIVAAAAMDDISTTSSHKTFPTQHNANYSPSHSPRTAIRTKLFLQTVSFRRGDPYQASLPSSSPTTHGGSGSRSNNSSAHSSPVRRSTSSPRTERIVSVSPSAQTPTITNKKPEASPSASSTTTATAPTTAPTTTTFRLSQGTSARASQRVTVLEQMVQQLQEHNERVENDLRASLQREAELESKITRTHRSQMMTCEVEAARKIEEAQEAHKKDLAVMGRALQQLQKAHEKEKKQAAEVETLREEVSELRQTSRELEKRKKQVLKLEEKAKNMTSTIETFEVEKQKAHAKRMELEGQVLHLRQQMMMMESSSSTRTRMMMMSRTTTIEQQSSSGSSSGEHAAEQGHHHHHHKAANDEVGTLALRHTDLKLQVAEMQLQCLIQEEMPALKEKLAREEKARQESAEKCARLEEELRRLRLPPLPQQQQQQQNAGIPLGNDVGDKHEKMISIEDDICSVLSGENTSETPQDTTSRKDLTDWQVKILHAWKERRASVDGEDEQATALRSTLTQLHQTQKALTEAEAREKSLKAQVMTLDLSVATLQQELNEEREKSAKAEKAALQAARSSAMEEAQKNLASVEERMNMLLQAERKQAKKKSEKAQEIVKSVTKEKHELKRRYEESMQTMKLTMDMSQAHFDSVEEDYQQQIARLKLMLTSADEESIMQLRTMFRKELESEALENVADARKAERKKIERKANSKISGLQKKLAAATKNQVALTAAIEVQESLVKKLHREKQELLRERPASRNGGGGGVKNMALNAIQDFMSFQQHPQQISPASSSYGSIEQNDTWDTASY